MMTEPLIELRNLTFSYPGAPFPIFQDFADQVIFSVFFKFHIHYALILRPLKKT